MRLLLQALLITVSWACATAPPVPPKQPDILPVLDSTPKPAPPTLRLTSGTVVYEFRQSADIRLEGGNDTTYTTITTEALFSAVVTTLSDSTYEITVSADSVRISTAGSLPSRSQGLGILPVSLGPILRAVVGPTTRDVGVVLPDSLCAYGQLVSIAQEMALLPLPATVLLGENSKWTDSSRFSTCRAGTTVETRAIREISYSSAQPNELALLTFATIQGSGTMQASPVTITGIVRSSGRALLQGAGRLPAMLQTESHGTISVRLQDSTTAFRQTSRQEWWQRLPN